MRSGRQSASAELRLGLWSTQVSRLGVGWKAWAREVKPGFLGTAGVHPETGQERGWGLCLLME